MKLRLAFPLCLTNTVLSTQVDLYPATAIDFIPEPNGGRRWCTIFKISIGISLHTPSIRSSALLSQGRIHSDRRTGKAIQSGHTRISSIRLALPERNADVPVRHRGQQDRARRDGANERYRHKKGNTSSNASGRYAICPDLNRAKTFCAFFWKWGIRLGGKEIPSHPHQASMLSFYFISLLQKLQT